MPETPAPVPTSTTARAPTVAARNRSTAPPPGPIGTAPSSWPRLRADTLPSVVAIAVRRGSGGDTGSGIVISNSGYILTNNHVIEPALNGGKLSVVFHDKHSVHGEIVGRDRVSDLAVVRVRGVRGLQPAVLGSSRAGSV